MDLSGWIKNKGDAKLPEGIKLDDMVDIIHRDGDVIYSVEAGRGFAGNFRLSGRKHVGDILYYRKESGGPVRVERNGRAIVNTLEAGGEDA